MSPIKSAGFLNIYQTVRYVIAGLERMAVGTSLVIQWLRLYVPSAGGPGSIPGQGTGSHMLLLS